MPRPSRGLSPAHPLIVRLMVHFDPSTRLRPLRTQLLMKRRSAQRPRTPQGSVRATGSPCIIAPFTTARQRPALGRELSGNGWQTDKRIRTLASSSNLAKPAGRRCGWRRRGNCQRMGRSRFTSEADSFIRFGFVDRDATVGATAPAWGRAVKIRKVIRASAAIGGRARFSVALMCLFFIVPLSLLAIKTPASGAHGAPSDWRGV